MRRTRDRRTSVRRGAAGGFTLVELVTAASLMTVMMLGVVEIFGIVTQTASEAEAQNFAFQQMRTFFDTLNRDLRGLNRDGYFYLKPNRFIYDSAQSTWTWSAARAPSLISDHAAYGLAFTSVGQWTGVWGTTSPQSANVAELLYTTNVITPTAIQNVGGRDVGIRRGILGRGVWLVNGQSPGATGQPGDHWSTGQYFLGNMLASATYRRVVADAANWDQLKIWPWLAVSKTVDGGSTRAPGLTRVMASCTSEFLVDMWKADVSSGAGGWNHLAFPGVPYNTVQGLYCNTWPAALRVTVVVHDPTSTEARPDDQPRFRGYALQETFYLGDR